MFFGWGLLCFCGAEVSCLGFVCFFFSKFRMVKVCCVRVLCVEGLSVFVSGFFTGFIAFLAV